MAKKPPSKLGRGLSALMADIAVPLEPKSAPKPTQDKPKPSNPKQAKTGDKKPTPPSMLSAVGKMVSPENNPPIASVRKGAIPSLEIDYIERNPDQPRKVFNKEKLAELTQSIQDNGVLQPILVRPLPARFKTDKDDDKSRYQIVAGERRWLAALMAGLLHMPAMVRDLSDQEVLEIGVIENVQRADLNPIEEAQAYAELINQFGRKQSEIASAIGKSRPYVANALRLLNLPKLAQEYLLDGKITAGHARAILSAPDPQALAEAVVRDDLSVRDTEKLARSIGKSLQGNTPQHAAPDANIVALEKDLSDVLGMKVAISHKTPGGSVSIKYQSMDQLDDLMKRLRKS